MWLKTVQDFNWLLVVSEPEAETENQTDFWKKL